MYFCPLYECNCRDCVLGFLHRQNVGGLLSTRCACVNFVWWQTEDWRCCDVADMLLRHAHYRKRHVRPCCGSPIQFWNTLAYWHQWMVNSIFNLTGALFCLSKHVRVVWFIIFILQSWDIILEEPLPHRLLLSCIMRSRTNIRICIWVLSKHHITEEVKLWLI